MEGYMMEGLAASKRYDLSGELLAVFFGMDAKQQEEIVAVALAMRTLSGDQRQRLLNLCRAMAQEVEQ